MSYYLQKKGANRDLHSFPTRRSSDLPTAGPSATGRRARPRTPATPTTQPAPTPPPRSEEHTSELQSHSDLVCRLLLEKKKGQNKIELVIEHALAEPRHKVVRRQAPTS